MRRQLLIISAAIASVTILCTGGQMDAGTPQNKGPDLYLILQGGKWGYINRDGTIAIAPKYDVADKFWEGMAAVQNGDIWGYIDETGVEVIPPQYRSVYGQRRRFSEGLAAVNTGDAYDERSGYIDKRGSVVIEPKFASAGAFCEGLAYVRIGREGNVGFIDRTARLVIPDKFGMAGCFSEGLAPAQPASGELFGYLDNAESFVIQPRFKVASSFVDGMARVFDRDVHCIDKRGEDVLCLSEGLAAGTRVKGGSWGYRDSTGKFAIPPRFDDALSFHEGYAAVKVDGKWGFIDKSGDIVIDPQFYSVRVGFSGGIAAVSIGGSPASFLPQGAKGHARGKLGYIDQDGKYVWVPTN